MPEPATYFYHHHKKPQDGQMVWLQIKGEKEPLPAQYTAQHGDGKPKILRGECYSLLRGRLHRPFSGESWAPMVPPENANLCSDAPLQHRHRPQD